MRMYQFLLVLLLATVASKNAVSAPTADKSSKSTSPNLDQDIDMDHNSHQKLRAGDMSVGVGVTAEERIDPFKYRFKWFDFLRQWKARLTIQWKFGHLDWKKAKESIRHNKITNEQLFKLGCTPYDVAWMLGVANITSRKFAEQIPDTWKTIIAQERYYSYYRYFHLTRANKEI